MKEVVSLQYRASASDSWQSQRLSHKGNRLTLSDKDSDMGTVYESEAELHIRTADYGIPAMDLLVRMWHIDDTYTDIGTTANPVRVQKRVDGVMVTAVLKHESIAAPVHGSVLYIPFQVGSEQVFPGSSFISIHPDSPASSFAIDGVQGVYTKMLTANTTVMLEVYDAETFRFQGMTFGGCKYVNLSQIKAKGVVVAGQYNDMSYVQLLSPLTKIDLPRVIDAQVLNIISDALQAVSFAHVSDMSDKYISFGSSLSNSELAKTLDNLIDAGYERVSLSIFNSNIAESITEQLMRLILEYHYTVSAAMRIPNDLLHTLNPQVNDLAYVVGFDIYLDFNGNTTVTGSYDLVSHPGITIRYDIDNDVLYASTDASVEVTLLEGASLTNQRYRIRWEKVGMTCILSLDGNTILSLDYAQLQIGGALMFNFAGNLVFELSVFGNPSIERTYNVLPDGSVLEKRHAETRIKYLTVQGIVPVYVIPQYTSPW